MIATGEIFKMTIKTKIYLFFHELFRNLSQWFIIHCDFEETKSFNNTEDLFEDLDGVSE